MAATYRHQTLTLGGLTSTSSRTADTKTALVFAVAVKVRFGEAALQRKTAPAMAGMGRPSPEQSWRGGKMLQLIEPRVRALFDGCCTLHQSLLYPITFKCCGPRHRLFSALGDIGASFGGRIAHAQDRRCVRSAQFKTMVGVRNKIRSAYIVIQARRNYVQDTKLRFSAAKAHRLL